MLKVDERVRAGSQPTLAEWASSALGLPEVRVQVRLRGNNLYLLCEGEPCPDVAIATPRFAQALAAHPLEILNPPNQPRIYQIFLSGRESGRNRPDWTVRLDPDRLDRYLKPEKTSTTPQPEPESAAPAQPTFSSALTARPSLAADLRAFDEAVSATEQGAPAFYQLPSAFLELSEPEPPSEESLVIQRQARRGNPEAIARYLSEILSSLGVAVRVRVTDLQNSRLPHESDLEAQKAEPSDEEEISSERNPLPSQSKTARKKRLWVLCESAYSPDSSLLAEPIASRLRYLLEKRQGESLQGFRDAVIVGQVSGEVKPEWMLRVDLTPPEKMLSAWACWGDVQAIALSVERALAEHSVAARAILQETTLHLFLNRKRSASPKEGTLMQGAPDKRHCISAIAALLEAIAPQGIQAVAVYGIDSEEGRGEKNPNLSPESEETPVWIEWLSVRSKKAPELQAIATQELAKQGNLEALAYLLDRVINPDLSVKLATGGIRLKVVRKKDILHVLSEAPVCPVQSKVGPPIAKFLRQLQVSGIEGLRAYGRRAGTKQFAWRYGDIVNLPPQPMPMTPPEFAISVPEERDNLPQPGDLVLRPDFKPDEPPGALTQLVGALGSGVQEILLRSQLFAPSNPIANAGTPQAAWIAAIWGTLGILLTVQADWLIGQQLRQVNIASGSEAELSLDSQETNIFSSSTPQTPATVSVPLPQLSLQRSKIDDSSVFNASGFTQSGGKLTITARCRASGGELDPERCQLQTSNYPSFNSRQLDEQLQVYQQYLAEVGTPDILIVGSSRALRGIDPLTLQKALAEQGYPGLKVFNFGINGATAQVADMVVRQILQPEQLPRMILWADGARAMNGGRQDVTYNAIAASAGYKQLAAGKFPVVTPGTDKSNPSSGSPDKPSAAPLTADKIWASNYQEIGQALNDKLALLSASYQQRDRLKALLQQQFSATLDTQLFSLNSQSAPKANSNKPAQAETADRTASVGSVDSNGFLALPMRFNPSIYYKRHARVPGTYDADYESFALPGRQTTALKTFMQFARGRGIPVIFINLPLTDDYLDPARKNFEQQFRQHMLRLAIEEEFVFRDLSEIWPSQNEFFSDPSHLNRYGAYEVSVRLAADPMIPWPTANKEVKSEKLQVRSEK